MSSSLYRCKCIVGYRPYGVDKIIPFSEKQIISMSMDLNWAPDGITQNQDSRTELTQFVNSLSGSKVSVTLSDPYMSGIAWAALFDSAAAYTNPSLAAYNNILLPECQEGQNPNTHKCTKKYQEIDDPNLVQNYQGNFAHILVTLWYEIGGHKFSLETYFRLQGFEIRKGSEYPQVTLTGVESQIISFNQTLANFQLKENTTIEDNLKEIVEKYNHKISFCTPPDANYNQKLILPKTFRETGVTAGEVIKKYLRSVNGSFQSLPTKEFAKKISVCTRANVNQGCSVFYLGKGLFEKYSISGNAPVDILNLNLEYNGYNPSLGFQTDTTSLTEPEYILQDLLPNKRKQKLKGAKTNLVNFPGQFESLDKRFSSIQGSSGYVFKDPGPSVKNKKLEKVNLFGIDVNGKKALSYLEGDVVTLSKTSGSVTIRTKYFLQVCKKGLDCVKKTIFQETRGLSTVDSSIEYGKRVNKNALLGESKDSNFTRFIIQGANASQNITLSPELVWKYAVPVEDLTPEEQEKAGVKAGASTPGNQVGSSFAGRVGNTGRSQGSHIHFEAVPRTPAVDEEKLNQQFYRYVKVSGVSRGRGYKSNGGSGAHGYDGAIDYPAPKGTPIYLINNAVVKAVESSGCKEGDSSCGGGFGNSVLISTPEGVFRLAHLDSTSGVKGGSDSIAAGSRYGPGVQSAPSAAGVEIQTEFRGVPRALRIIPGRTILSLITKYDDWIENGRPDSIDPGIWIPERYSKWFIRSVQYNWSMGDLRVNITAVSDWGVAATKVPSPSFDEYLRESNFEYTNDYYGYIRSAGDLCWKVGDKSSCEMFCAEAEEVRQFLAAYSPQSTTTPGFSSSDCRYVPNSGYLNNKATTMEIVMSALKSVGITTKEAYAGVLGNFSVESTLTPSIQHGSGCSGSPAYGIAQWCYSRQDGVRAFCSKTPGLECEMRFMVKEIKEGKDVDPALVSAINKAKTASEAALIWNRYFERSEGYKYPNSEENLKRAREAEKIYSGLKCSRTA